MIRHIALVLNFLCPGIGSLLLGKWRVGLVQLVIIAICFIAISRTSYGMYFWLLGAADWAWGLYTAEYSPRTGGVAKRRA